MNIGKHIRELRKKYRLTLAELSKKSGVALATLSRIETGKMIGTLKSHIAIAKALDMTLPELYADMDKPITVQKEQERADVFIHDERTASIILTKDIFEKKMLPVLMRLKPGGRTHKEELRKGTERFLYVLAGKLEVVIGEEKNTLEKGSTLYFDASRPHFARNIGTGEAVCLCVSTPVSL